MYKLNGREVEITDKEIEVGEGVWIVDAYFTDTDVDLTDEELRELEDVYQVELYEDAYADMACRAHDSMEDR